MKINLKEHLIEGGDIYYILSIDHRGYEWNIKKRFSQFLSLSKEFVINYPDIKIPRLHRQFVQYNQDLRDSEIRIFIDFIVGNNLLKTDKQLGQFICSDIIINSIDEFMSITKNKQKEYVKNFLQESKIMNYKNYITNLENQIMESIQKRKECLAELEKTQRQLYEIDKVYNTAKISLTGLEAENREFRKIFESQRKNIAELEINLKTALDDFEHAINRSRDLEMEIRILQDKIKKNNERVIELESKNYYLDNQYRFAQQYIPSAPPLEDTCDLQT